MTSDKNSGKNVVSGYSRLFFGGPILTMTPEYERRPYPEALLAGPDGRIVFVGPLSAARACAQGLGVEVRELDLQGAALLPGFIDAHSHFSGVSQYFTTAALGDARSIDDLVARLRGFADRTAAGGQRDAVVLGTGYDLASLHEARHPNRHDLDRVSADRPVLAVHVSGHMLVANSVALRLAGITKDTPDPAGARFGREEDGSPDGLCQEPAAIFAVYRALGSRMDVDAGAVVDEIQDEYLSHGITTAQDGATTSDWSDKLARLAQERRLRLDLVAYPLRGQDVGNMLSRHRRYVGHRYRNHLRIGGLKLIIDGSPQARTAWVSEPYAAGAEGAGFRGAPQVSEQEAYEFALKAIDKGLQLLAHTNGDAASELLLNAYGRALADSPNPRKHTLRPVMVHCQLVRRDQLARMSALHMFPSFFVSHCWYWGDTHLRNFGEQRGSRISPVGDAADLGLPYTFHTDSPIIRPNLLEAVWCAAARRTSSGVALDPAQRVPVAQGLKAITANAAWQYGEELTKGTLEVGKLADLCVLERDPLAVPLDDSGAPDEALRSIRTLAVYKAGHEVWRA